MRVRRGDALGNPNRLGQLGQLAGVHAVTKRRKLQRLFVFGVLGDRSLQVDQRLAELRGLRLETFELTQRDLGVVFLGQPFVDDFGAGRVELSRLESAVRDLFKLTPAGIISSLDLLKPIYSPTAAHGHFGRTPVDGFFNWERTDKAEALRSLA